MTRKKSIGEKTLSEACQDVWHGVKATGSAIRTGACAVGTGLCAIGSAGSWTYSNILKPIAKPTFTGLTGVALGLFTLYGVRSFNGEFNQGYDTNFPNAIYEFNLGSEGHFAVIEQRNGNLTDFKTLGVGKYGKCQRLEDISANEKKKADEEYNAKVDLINKQYDKLKGN